MFMKNIFSKLNVETTCQNLLKKSSLIRDNPSIFFKENCLRNTKITFIIPIFIMFLSFHGF